MRIPLILAAALAVAVPALVPRAPRVASAEECPFCHKDIEEGRGTFNCRACEETANVIARETLQWTLEFKHEKPRRVTVKGEANAHETYWWFAYTIKNVDKDAHSFSIAITAESDKGKNVAKYIDTAVPEVTAEVRRILGVKEGETLDTQAELSGVAPGGQHTPPAKDAPPAGESAKLALPTVKPGQVRRCIAMFKAFDPELDVLTIRVHGLSSDVEVEPIADQPFRRKVRDRVLEIKYESPGDEFMTQVRPITFVSQKWVEVEQVVKSDLR